MCTLRSKTVHVQLPPKRVTMHGAYSVVSTAALSSRGLVLATLKCPLSRWAIGLVSFESQSCEKKVVLPPEVAGEVWNTWVAPNGTWAAISYWRGTSGAGGGEMGVTGESGSGSGASISSIGSGGLLFIQPDSLRQMPPVPLE